MDMIPKILKLDPNCALVEDADEEIFLLYTRKLATSPTTSSATLARNPAGIKGDGGLGFLNSSSEVLPISFVLADPRGSTQDDIHLKGKKGKRREIKEVAVDLEICQDLDGLRNRKGDTGSVVWRVSLYFAQFLLSQHHFPPLSSPLFPTLPDLNILELGSGTGFLGLLLLPILASPTNWTFSDQLPSLPLILKNMRKNSHCYSPPASFRTTSKSSPKPSLNSSLDEPTIKELDWLNPSLPPSAEDSPTLYPDLILALDCIYNPSLALPLVSTISAQSGRNTVVLVGSELRDEEPLEVFLRGWMEVDGGEWCIWRVGFEIGEKVGEKEFVVWAGWRKGAK